MGTTYNKQFAIQGEDNLYYRVDYLLKHYLRKSYPRINRILKTYQTDGTIHVSKSKGKYFRDQSGPLRFIEVAFWNQIVSDITPDQSNKASTSQIDQSMFSKYSEPFGNHERLGDHCPGLYFNKIDCLHNMQSQDHFKNGESAMLDSASACYDQSNWICKIGKAKDMNKRFSQHNDAFRKISDDIQIQTLHRQPIPDPSLYQAEEDIHVALGKCVKKRCRPQCLGQTCKDVKGKCPVHPCRPAIHETDQYIYADHFPTTRTVPDEWFVMKNSSEIDMVISKMNMIGDRYKDSANDRAVRAEGLCDFMYKLREEEREQHKEQVKEEREQHEKEREQYKEQVAMLTKKLELLPFKDRKRLDKLYRKKKAEERKLKELEELEELEECDSEEE